MPRVRTRGGRNAKNKTQNKCTPQLAKSLPLTQVSSSFPSLLGEDLIYGSSLDVFEEVIIEDEPQFIDVDISSESPISKTDECFSNENSLSSFTTSESQSRFWTSDKDLTPSEVLPDNLFTETEDEINTFSIEQPVDAPLTMNDEPFLNITNLFPVEEEKIDPTSKPKSLESSEEGTKKGVRRRIKAETNEHAQNTRLMLLSKYEEHVLLRQLEQIATSNLITPEQRRLHRKLCLRKIKESLGIEPFNFDFLVGKLSGHQPNYSKSEEQKVYNITNVLDRFQKYPLGTTTVSVKQNVTFRARLIGSEGRILHPIVSPYTGRTLKPFIRRDYETKPLKLRLLNEIRQRCSEKDTTSKPIDYCYVQPHHIPAVNAICREVFWTGIDLTECLEYPDFSCVVLYGHIVVGFAFMVPDVSYNEAYISYIYTHPEWRKAGIGKFMLYHLIQSCMGKDVTLHVSATNPALNLYHQFGFKVEEFVVDFYDKYFTADSNQCKHALFMRLAR